MAGFMESMEGKRTHVLVVGAIVIYALGIMSTPNGMQLDALSSQDLSHMLLMGTISTFKLGIERALATRAK